LPILIHLKHSFPYRSCHALFPHSEENREQIPGSPLADLQQFFTGKLYVLVYQLKLPAEELLWLALSWHVSTVRCRCGGNSVKVQVFSSSRQLMRLSQPILLQADPIFGPPAACSRELPLLGYSYFSGINKSYCMGS